MNSFRVLKWKDKTLDLTHPVVMGILNITPDSFFDGGNYFSPQEAINHAIDMKNQGAKIIDIGAVSTRPFAENISEEEEWERISEVLPMLRKVIPETWISVDTYRASIAMKALEAGADMINDISAGQMDSAMFPAIAELGAPYIMMHMQGAPQTMQQDPRYENVTDDILKFFTKRIKEFQSFESRSPIIIDPGFGFGKTVDHNYQLLNSLSRFKSFGFPVLAGISRKSMINRVLGIKPEQALNGTTVLNTICLLNGADILRVHDVKEACEAIQLVGKFLSGKLIV